MHVMLTNASLASLKDAASQYDGSVTDLSVCKWPHGSAHMIDKYADMLHDIPTAGDSPKIVSGTCVH
jgi:hypothetical protein